MHDAQIALKRQEWTWSRKGDHGKHESDQRTTKQLSGSSRIGKQGAE
jgi:hypothetical protein